MSSTATTIKPNETSATETSSSSKKTMKNRKYRHHQREKRNSSKKERVEKIMTLNKDMDTLLKANALLRKENREKSETIDELRLLLIESKKKVTELEKIEKKEHEENEFLMDFDLDF